MEFTKLKIEKTLTLDELIASGYMRRQYENFGMEHLLNRDIAVFTNCHEGPTTFFIVKANPDHNYGLDFIIYQRYMADGINFFSKVSHTSALTSNAFKSVFCPQFINDADFLTKMIVAGLITKEASETITIKHECYSRDNKARAYFRKHADIYTLTTSF